MPLTGKRILVTGSASRIGEATVDLLKQRGAPVVAFLSEDGSSWVTGANIPVDGGMESIIFGDTFEFARWRKTPVLTA